MTTLKTCFKCGVPQLRSEFYKHSQTTDGLLGKCKSCAKSDVSRNYAKTREDKAAYDRERQQKPERRAKKLEYQRKFRAENPEKYKARGAVNNAIRDGRLKRLPCETCGTTERVHAHHADYSKPLDVKWLCHKHHLEDEHGKVTMKLD